MKLPIPYLLCSTILLGFTRLQALTIAPTDNISAPYMGVYEWSIYNPGSQDRIEYTADWLSRKGLWAEDFAATDSWDNLRGPGWLFGVVRDWVAQHPERKFIFSEGLLPGATNGSGPKKGLEAGIPVSLAKGAAGEYNHHFQRLAERLVETNIADHVIIRLAWEFNGGWYAWRVTNKKMAKDFTEYWRQVVTTMRTVPGAENIEFCWNGCIGWTKYPLEMAYPGDDYVDYIGIDVYDQCWADDTYPYPDNATPEEILQRQKKAWGNIASTAKGGLLHWRDFALAHNKPLAIPEWGVADRADGHGGGDNPYFVQQMYDFIQNPANNVAWHVYFNIKAPDGDHQLTDFNGFEVQFPDSAALFQKLFSARPLTETYDRTVAIADADVRSGKPKVNFGTADEIGTSAESRESYLQFDVSGLENANKVTLTLTAQSWSLGEPFTCALVSDDDWEEETIVWENRPSADSEQVYAEGACKDHLISFDVTAIAKAEAAGDGILSLKVMSSGSNWCSFYSREATSVINRPALEYTKPIVNTTLLIEQSTNSGRNTEKLD